MHTPSELTERFRSAGFRVTAQRQAVFRALHGNDRHPTVEALHDVVRLDVPAISLRTVYQTVHDLESLGEVAVLDLGTGSVRVDPNVDATHHHLVCTSCGAVRDVPVDLGGLEVPARLRQGFRVDEVDVVFAACVSTVLPIVQTPTRSTRMADLKDSKTEANLKEAFAGESQANRRYLYFAQKADVEGYPDVASLFRSVAEGETGHAFGHFDFLAQVGDPVTGVAVGPTTDNLKSAIAGETYEYTEMYPGFARTARDEGFEEVAEWFETLARAEKSHAGRFASGLETVS